MTTPESRPSYDYDFFDRINRKNTEEELIRELSDEDFKLLPKNTLTKYIIDACVDPVEKASAEDISKRNELLYEAVAALDEVADFLSTDMSEILSPDYPEKAEELHQKTKRLADDLDERCAKLDGLPESYFLDFDL